VAMKRKPTRFRNGEVENQSLEFIKGLPTLENYSKEESWKNCSTESRI